MSRRRSIADFDFFDGKLPGRISSGAVSYHSTSSRVGQIERRWGQLLLVRGVGGQASNDRRLVRVHDQYQWGCRRPGRATTCSHWSWGEMRPYDLIGKTSI